MVKECIPLVLVPLAQGCEELEAVTIIDILRRAGVDVVTASLDDEPVTASRGTKLIADTTLDQVMDEQFDMVVLPGGLPGADHLNADQRVHTILKRTIENQKRVAAICAAPKVLAQAGLLDGKTVTAYPGVFVPSECGAFTVTNAAVERDGNVLTSRGPGTAMEFALEIVSCLQGGEKRQEVEADLRRAA